MFILENEHTCGVLEISFTPWTSTICLVVYLWYIIITARNGSCGKVMFS